MVDHARLGSSPDGVTIAFHYKSKALSDHLRFTDHETRDSQMARPDSFQDSVGVVQITQGCGSELSLRFELCAAQAC